MGMIKLRDILTDPLFENLHSVDGVSNDLKYSDNHKINLSEIDWKSSDLEDVKVQSCMSNDQVVTWLNNELKRYTDGGKAAANMPRVSRGNILIKDTAIDIDGFIKLLTTPPKTIFDEGMKSLHTTNADVLVINTGIPAMRGFVYDKEDINTPFKVVNTCPAAGVCSVDCYALQGFYIMNDGKNIKLAQRLQLIMENPEMYLKIGYSEAELYAFKANRDGKTLEIRWNDAGDFFSQRYFNLATVITKKLLENNYKIKSYFYTKVSGRVDIGEKLGFTVTFSQGGVESNPTASKQSIIIPTSMFSDILKKTKGRGYEKDLKTGKTSFIDAEVGKVELKRRIFEKYKDQLPGLTLESIMYTDELPPNEESPGKFSAIILPSGDSDRPAQRKDVRYIFLLKH